jgi:hypothetical protein
MAFHDYYVCWVRWSIRVTDGQPGQNGMNRENHHNGENGQSVESLEEDNGEFQPPHNGGNSHINVHASWVILGSLGSLSSPLGVCSSP